MQSLVLRLNLQKSGLLPKQHTIFLGVDMDSDLMQAHLSLTRVALHCTCLSLFLFYQSAAGKGSHPFALGPLLYGNNLGSCPRVFPRECSS